MVWTILVLVVAAAIVFLLLKGVTTPAAFSLQRAIDIAAPPGKVFALIDDFHAWVRWSPWEGLDPTQQRTYDGPQTGKGAKYGWAGSGKVGSGQMAITESVPFSKIAIQLDFVKPFEAHNAVEFLLTPNAPGTHVVWIMTGRHAFVFRMMSAFFNMDKLVGGDFERGLAKLKAEAEK